MFLTISKLAWWWVCVWGRRWVLGSFYDISTWDSLKKQNVVKALGSIPEMQEEMYATRF